MYKVEFQDLPAEAQEMLVNAFAGYDINAIFQHTETGLLKVVAVKDGEESTFVQNEEGTFVEQE
ncbi:MAG: hypothetical protein FWC34_02345 [Bacteroidetes bacterium]|nr:hypothetical protein [Bacteroidota bacterium]MCL2301716.1 hypothetical protein [Lentimicrobiaceae bacterium]